LEGVPESAQTNFIINLCSDFPSLVTAEKQSPHGEFPHSQVGWPDLVGRVESVGRVGGLGGSGRAGGAGGWDGFCGNSERGCIFEHSIVLAGCYTKVCSECNKLELPPMYSIRDQM
jgi:hypothetical protein